MTSEAVPVAVKVRALVASAEDGSWCVIGHPGWTDEDLIEDARLLLGDGEMRHYWGEMRHYWIEMELELPN
jgi:hypothetical protein